MIASVMGGAVDYGVGAPLFDMPGQWRIHLHGCADNMAARKENYVRWDAPLILIKGLTPIPSRLVAIVSGALDCNFVAFVAVSPATRGARRFPLAGRAQSFRRSLAPRARASFRRFPRAHHGHGRDGLVRRDAGVPMSFLAAALPKQATDNALAIGGLAFVTIAGAWVFQALGFAPCDLCLEQRYAYYAGVPAAAIAFALAASGSSRALTRALFWLLALIFAANVVLAAYHSGIEAHLWPGPTACTGSIAGAESAGSLLDQLAKVKVVNCDVVQLRVFGLSLANWNVLVSGALTILSARAALARG
jgi:disulfide bond formation protein DsbB